MKAILTTVMVLLAAGIFGQQLFYKTFPKPDWDYADAVIERNDGNYLIAGSSRSRNGTDYDISLILVDSLGNTIWDKYLGQADSMEFAYSLLETSDGNFLASGRIGMYFPYLSLFNANGELIRNMRFPGVDQSYGAYSVGETADNNYYFIQPGPVTTFNVINPLGDIILSKSYDYAYCNAVIQTSDMGFMLAGHKEVQYGYYENMMIRTNAEGDTLWTKNYWIGIPGYIKECRFQSGYILSSSMWISNGGIYDYFLFITRFDTAGNMIWSRQFDGFTYQPGNNVTQTSDGGFLLTGHVTGNPCATDAILIKLDSLGDYVLSTKEIDFPGSSEILTYPNPVKDFLNFRLPDPDMKILELRIFNIFGQEITVRPVSSGNVTNLRLSGHAPGIHFYCLTARNNRLFKGKFVVSD